MAAIKHKYVFSFNRFTDEGEVISYRYSGKDLSMWISSQCVTATFDYGPLKPVEEFITFGDKLYHDMYRKAILLHAVKMGEPLRVEKLIFRIDDTETVVDKDHDPTGYFPYMTSMLGEGRLEFGERWQELIPRLANAPKTKAVIDPRFAAFYSYLASKNREHTMDRFTNLWTAMNACYVYQVDCYKHWLTHEEHYNKPEKWNNLAAENESDQIGWMVWQLDGGKYKKWTAQEAEEVWNNKQRWSMDKVFQEMTREDAAELYRIASKGEPCPERYQPILARAQEFELGLFSFLLLEYPYHWRCKFLHGDIATMLAVGYNDYEPATLKALCYFLDTYLNEAIPDMFLKPWNQERQEAMKEYLRFIKQDEKGRDKYTKWLTELGLKEDEPKAEEKA